MPKGRKNGKPKDPERIEKRKQEFADYMRKEVLQDYDQPFMGAISALPRQDLAKMAEALVNLTAFLMRMTVDQDETVTEPIDVALLSKGDGFTWIKHKDLVRSAGLLALLVNSKAAKWSARHSRFATQTARPATFTSSARRSQSWYSRRRAPGSARRTEARKGLGSRSITLRALWSWHRWIGV